VVGTVGVVVVVVVEVAEVGVEPELPQAAAIRAMANTGAVRIGGF